MNNIFLVLTLFLAHYLGDFTHLSTPKMLEAKRFADKKMPILAHAFVHAILQAFVFAVFGFSVNAVASSFFAHLFFHFCIDVWKGKMNANFEILQNPAKKPHWYIFGLDQFFHQVTILIVVYLLS
jgi:hypothetical protein